MVYELKNISDTRLSAGSAVQYVQTITLILLRDRVCTVSVANVVMSLFSAKSC